MMSDNIPNQQPQRLRPKDASTYLRDRWGISHSEQTLARKRVEGTGPKFSTFGRFINYSTDHLDEYAKSGTSRALSSTSDRDDASAPAAA